MSDSIPCGKLNEGIALHFDSVEGLIESADLLCQKRKFMYAASLAVFAFEEMSKIDLLLNYSQRGSDLPLDEWKKLTKNPAAHREKLHRFLEGETIRMLSPPPKDIAYTKEDAMKDIANHWDSIKMNVFYVNWMQKQKGLKEPRWRWFPQEYPEDFQKVIALNLMRTAKKRCDILKDRFSPG